MIYSHLWQLQFSSLKQNKIVYEPILLTVAESVECRTRVQEIVGSNPLSNQTNDLLNWYLSLPSQVLGIIRIGQGLIGSVLG